MRFWDWQKAQQAGFERFALIGSEIAQKAAAMDAENSFNQSAWEHLANTGIWDLAMDPTNEENWWQLAASLEGLASTCLDSGFLFTAVAHAAFMRGLSLQGNLEQKEKWLKKLAKGMLVATAIAEPHSGTDAANVLTLAKEGERNWLLSGTKWNISHAPTAELCLILGKVEHLGTSLFLLERARAGLSSGSAQSKMGNRSLPTSWLKMDNCLIEASDIVGQAGKGMRALADFVTLARIWDGWMGAMLICPLLEKAMTWLEARQSFGKSLTQHQYVQGKLSEALIGLHQARWIGRGAFGQMLAKEKDAAMLSSIAKISGSRAALNAALDLLSLLGSEGYLEGPFERLTRDAIGLMMVGGTEEMHKINIFNQFSRLSQEG